MTEAGVAYVQLVPSMKGFGAAVSSGMKGELDSTMKGEGAKSGRSFMTGFSDTLVKQGRNVSDVGDKMTLGLTIPLAIAANKMTNLASDTNESLSKVQTIFGGASGSIENFSKNAAQNMGLSNRAALEATGTFGNMFTQMGIGVGEASDLSMGMTTLAADFGAFHNADTTEVLNAQSAAFRGEFDALQKFVPLINAAAVEQRALADSGKESADELTAQEKALATYALMVDGAGAAVGDFKRTQDQLAGSQRTAAAEAEDAAAAFGENLIPIKQDLIGVATELTGAFNNLSPAQQEMIVKAGVAVAALGPLLSITGRLATGVGGLIKVFGGLGKGVGFLAKGGAKIVTFAARGAVAFGRLALAAGRAGLQVIRAGAQMALSAARAVARVIASIVVQIAHWIMLGVQALLSAAKVALAWLISLGPIAILIAAVIAAVILIIANWDKVSAFIVAAAQWMWGVVTAIWTSIVDWVMAAVDSIVGFVSSIPGRIVDFLVAIFDLYVTYWTFIIDFVMGIVDEIVDFVGGIPGRIIGFLSEVWDLFVSTWEDIKSTTSDAIDAIVNWFGGIPGRVGSAISAVTEKITAPFRNAFNAIRSLWNSTVGGFGFSMPSWIPILGSKSFRIPRMHSGGIFEAPGGASEGLALLQSGEGVVDRGTMRAANRGGGAAGGNVVEIILGAGDRDLTRWLRKSVRVNGAIVSTTTQRGAA